MQAPLFDWLHDRAAGVILHPTSLPNEEGIGTLGGSAYQLVDFLAESEMTLWQVLPLGPTGFGDSPYASFSAMAGNPYLVDLQALVTAGLLDASDLDPLRELSRTNVDFGALYQRKWPLLRRAARTFFEQGLAYVPGYPRFADFCQAEAGWLDAFSLFMALKEYHGGAFWGDWAPEWRSFAQAQRQTLPETVAATRQAHQFYQYLFFTQWEKLRTHARQRGVEIMGDAPIFVALDSADVWAHPEIFDLDANLTPTHVAGVPPDYFSPQGQLWGNPLYNWKALKKTGYQWWMERLAMNFRLFDIVRLDHFRGFYDYWRIPAEAEDARGGAWADGPKLDFFKAVKKQFPEARLIAEDLGDLDDTVRDFRRTTGLPGMTILQFAFDGQGGSLYLPHMHERSSVTYPGVHDNNTTRGWYETASDSERDQVRRYLRISGEDIAWDLIRSAYRSVARLAIFQMQDLLSLGSAARFNTPGLAEGNWQWRMTAPQFHQVRGSAAYLRELAWLYGR